MFGGQIGMGEVLVIGIVAILLFGRRLPEVARSLGRSVQEFKKGIKEAESEVTKMPETKEQDKQKDEKSKDPGAGSQPAG